VGRVRTLVAAVNDVCLAGGVEWVADDARIGIARAAHCESLAPERLESLRANLVLTDVTVPDISGFDVARRVESRAGAASVVTFSFYDSRAARLEGLAASADGFAPKSQTAGRRFRF